MKVKVTDRFFLAVYAFLGILGSAILGMVIYFRKELSLQVMGYTVSFQDNTLTVFILTILAVLLLAWSIKIMIMAFSKPPKVDKSSVAVQNTEAGAVRISVPAMDTLVRQAIGNTEGIADVKTNVVNHDDSITVNIEMALESDVHIPNITMLMQRSIKSFIEEFSGIAVREVTILIARIVEVTPHPPLAIQAPRRAQAVLQQPQNEVPEATDDDESSAQPGEIEDDEPVIEYESDHIQPNHSADNNVPPSSNEGKHKKKSSVEPGDITDRDVW